MGAALRVLTVAAAVTLVSGGISGPSSAGFPGGTPTVAGHAREAAPASCDRSGDRRGLGDCVTHRALGRATDGVVRAGSRLKVRVGAHRVVRGAIVTTSIQVRPINEMGTAFAGRWSTIKRTRWTAQRRDVVKVRAPQEAGGYALRVAATSSRTPSGSGRARATGPAPTATSAPSALATQSAGCPLGPDDELGIDYFNEIEFSDEILLQILDGDVPPSGARAGTYSIVLDCPPPQSPTMPPPNFELTLSTMDESQSVTCDAGTIVMEKADIPDDDSCLDDRVCSFIVVLSNSSTGAVFSTTQVLLPLQGGNVTYVPELNPATLPICRPSFSPCFLNDSCGMDPNGASS